MGFWGESVRQRELRQTREAWSEVEEAWQRQELLTRGPDHLALALLLVHDRIASRLPKAAIFMALFEATLGLLEGEDLAPIEPEWDLIASDVSAAVNFRKLTARRRAWAFDTNARMGLVQKYLLGLWKAVLAAMPENCFREDDDDGVTATFDVPLVEVLRNPAELVMHCVMFGFAPEYVKGEMFERVRGQLRRNLLLASGQSPDADVDKVHSRLVMPMDARGKTPAELVNTYLADTPFVRLFEAPAPFSIPTEVRFEHGHILGGTGAGKTQLLQRMIHADLASAAGDGRSVVVIDSQGDLINKLVRLDLFSPEHPNSLADRLVLVDPSDVEHPPALNLFDAHLGRLEEYRPVDRERVLNGVVELYETMFGDMLGAELTQKQGVVFRYIARLMVTLPGATIYTLMELMENGRAFKPQMAELEGSARHFFETEFFDPSFTATKKQILRRLWGVLSTPAFERMFAQPKNKLDLFQATREGKIILISTAKELLKRDGSALLGRFFINMLAQAALERSVLDPDERTPTFVYVDEAQEYFDDSVETILQQARKYRIGLVAAHQSLDQASPAMRSALLANTSFKCVSGVSAKDARVLADELRTEPSFIESMRRRQETTEFAAWVKHETPRAIRLAVPLGYLERQPVLREEELDALFAENRKRYCGTPEALERHRAKPAATAPAEATVTDEAPIVDDRSGAAIDPSPAVETPQPHSERRREARGSAGLELLGKGGQKHRYLQDLVKGLAEARGFRATVEAPLGGGQADVLLERDDLTVAVEVSVTTPVDWERQNLRKCLDATTGPVALVLAKSEATARRYREAVIEGLSEADRARLSILNPEEVADFIASLTPPTEPTDTLVKGWKVKVSRSAVSPEEARARRETVARLIADSMKRQPD